MSKSDGGITRRELIKGSVAAGGRTLLGTPAISVAQQSATQMPSPHADLADK